MGLQEHSALTAPNGISGSQTAKTPQPRKKRKATLGQYDVIDLTADKPIERNTSAMASPGPLVERVGDSGGNAEAKRKKKAAAAQSGRKDALGWDASPKKGKERIMPHNLAAALYDHDTAEPPKKKMKQDPNEDKRLRRWRKAPPGTFKEVKERALTQRMFALDRQRDMSNPEYPTETITLAGTTGNVYTIVIDKVPSCNCPHAAKGHQCKHIAYVLSRVLRVRADLEYQLAFISSELREIFAAAPPLPSETASESAKNGNRKPIEGECPICYADFEPDSKETIVYCKASCGNNVHKGCMTQWAASNRGGNVTCPLCRSPWQSEDGDAQALAKCGKFNAEGYVNVASQLGLSGQRDYSSYHSYWVRDQARRGEIAWDEEGVMDNEYR